MLLHGGRYTMVVYHWNTEFGLIDDDVFELNRLKRINYLFDQNRQHTIARSILFSVRIQLNTSWEGFWFSNAGIILTIHGKVLKHQICHCPTHYHSPSLSQACFHLISNIHWVISVICLPLLTSNILLISLYIIILKSQEPKSSFSRLLKFKILLLVLRP